MRGKEPTILVRDNEYSISDINNVVGPRNEMEDEGYADETNFSADELAIRAQGGGRRHARQILLDIDQFEIAKVRAKIARGLISGLQSE